MAVVVFGLAPTPVAQGVYQRGTSGGGTGRTIFGVPPAPTFTYRYQARKSSDGTLVTWTSDGPDPTGIRAGYALVSGSISRIV